MARNIDYYQVDQEALEEMPNGFLSMIANLTRTGIFTYQQVDPDGTVKILRQLRIPEEVFSESAMATLAGLPLTNNHPQELVSPENASDYVVGMTSDRPKKVLAPVTDGDDSVREEFIQQQLTVFDGPTIEEVKSRRKTQISLGYKCELDFTPGEYKGEQYDCIQRNISMNHVSLVKRARGGNNCRIIMDGSEQVVNLDGETLDDEIKKPKENELKIFILDGVEYKVEDSVHAILTSMKSRQDELSEELTAKKKSLDKVTAQCDDLQTKIKIQNDSDDKAEFNAAVRERVALETKALPILDVENLDGISDDDVKKKVIAKLRPGVNLDGKSSEYIDARYDIAIEDAPKDKNKLGKKIIENEDSDEDVFSVAEAARKKAWEKQKTLYLGGK